MLVFTAQNEENVGSVSPILSTKASNLSKFANSEAYRISCVRLESARSQRDR